MKKYTQESKLSLGNLKNSSKQTGVLDLKPTGIVHSIGYKQVQSSQSESTVASDFLARHHQDSMNAYYMNQSQIINQTNRNIEFIQKRQVIERKIDEIDEQLNNPSISRAQKRTCEDIKNQYEQEIEQLELKENPDIMKRIQELTNHIEKLATTLTQSEAEKEILKGNNVSLIQMSQEIVAKAQQDLAQAQQEIQDKDEAIATFIEIQQILPTLQENLALIPEIKAKNEELHEALLKNNEELLAKEEALLVSTQQVQELQATIAMGLTQLQPSAEPNVTQDLEAKLKLKGEIKGDIRMIKLAVKKNMLDEEIKPFIKKMTDEIKFDQIKEIIMSNPIDLNDDGYDSGLAGDIMNDI